MQELKDLFTETSDLHLHFGMKSDDIGGLVSRKYANILYRLLRFLYDLNGYRLFNNPIGYSVPNVLEIDFPFIILILQANLLDPLIQLLPIKEERRDLFINLLNQLLFSIHFKEIKKVIDLSLFLRNDLTQSFIEILQ